MIVSIENVAAIADHLTPLWPSPPRLAWSKP
jgi:hypothetical protein